jgi:hypothetical protein
MVKKEKKRSYQSLLLSWSHNDTIDEFIRLKRLLLLTYTQLKIGNFMGKKWRKNPLTYPRYCIRIEWIGEESRDKKPYTEHCVLFF